MNAPHPIDDLFAQGLRNAEAAPPAAVWTGVLHARKARRTRARRRRWLVALAALLLLGLASWPLLHEGAGPAPATATIPPPERTGSAQGTLPPPGAGTPTTQPAATATAQGTSPVIAPDEHTTAGDRTAPKAATRPRSRPQEGRPAAASTATTDRTEHAPAAGTSNDGPGAAGDPMAAGTRPAQPRQEGGSQGSAAADPGADPTAAMAPRPVEDAERFRLERLRPLLAQASPATGASTPRSLPIGPGYLLPSGFGWLALETGLTQVNGAWQGTSAEVDALNQSETWRERTAVGLAGGWQWRSGWSVGLGAGVASTRSRALGSVNEPSYVENTVDTNWVATAVGQHSVYTWNIDSAQVERPGAERKYSSTNRYTAVYLAPEVGYWRDVRRFTWGVRTGAVIGIPVQRTGNTLEQADGAGDAQSTAFNLQPVNDDRFQRRFPVSISFFASAELRYHLTEHWAVGLGPSYITDLAPTAGAAPVMRLHGLGGSLRLILELPCHTL